MVCIWMDMALAVYITSPFTALPSHKRGNSIRYLDNWNWFVSVHCHFFSKSIILWRFFFEFILRRVCKRKVIIILCKNFEWKRISFCCIINGDLHVCIFLKRNFVNVFMFVSIHKNKWVVLFSTCITYMYTFMCIIYRIRLHCLNWD